MTLQEFITACGTQELAAHKLGVAFSTLNAWACGRREPSRLSKIKLAEHEVMI